MRSELYNPLLHTLQSQQRTCKVWRVSNTSRRGHCYLATTDLGEYLYEAIDYWEMTCWAREEGYRIIPKFHKASGYQLSNMRANAAGNPYKAGHPAASDPAENAYSNYREGWIRTATHH